MEKKIFQLFMLSSGISVGMTTANPQQAERPNILILFADDLGWNDISSPIGTGNRGSLNHETPNIDRFFNESKVFTRSYAQQNSAPTRAAMLTGQYATRSGVFNVGSLERGEGDVNTTMIIPPTQRNNIELSSITFAETLKTAGYKSYIFGKVHGWNGNLTTDHGFDYNFFTSKKVKRDGQDLSNYFAYYYNGKWIFDEPTYDDYAQPYTAEYIDKHLKPFANGNNPDILVGTPKHYTDAIADCVIDQIAAAADKDNPFCMWVSFHAIHSAIVSREDLYEKYRSRTNLDPRHTNFRYAALTEQLDQSVGRILAALEDPNGDGDTSDSMINNTLVIFTSDNGGVGIGHGGHLNTPLRGEKGNFYEAGVRVPFAARLPNKITPGTVSDEPIHTVDYYPTLADIGGATLPAETQHILDGESFLPILFEEKDTLPRQFIRWHFPGYLDTRMLPTTVVMGRVNGSVYKLHYFYEQQRYELYNMEEDELEQNNLLSDLSPELLSIANVLRSDMVSWLQETNTYKMRYRSNGNDVELPVDALTNENKISFSNGEIDLGYVSVGSNFENNSLMLWIDGATELPVIEVSGSPAFVPQIPQNLTINQLSSGVEIPFEFEADAVGVQITTITVNCGSASRFVNLKATVSAFGESFSKSYPESGSLTDEELNELYAHNDGWKGHLLTIGLALKVGEYSRLSAAIGSQGAVQLTSPEIICADPFRLQFRGRMLRGGVDNSKRNFFVLMGNDTLYNHELALNNTYTTHALRSFTYQTDEPFKITFSAASKNQGAESDGITIGEIQIDKTALPTLNVGVGQNWMLGSIAPREEKDFYFPLKGWNLTTPLSINLQRTSDEITLMNTSFSVLGGKVDENLHVRIKPSDQLGERKEAIRISGGGINTPSNRTLWMHYDVNPFQQLLTPALIPSIVSDGSLLKINIEYPATIRLMSVDGRIVSFAKEAQTMHVSLRRGVYLISVDGRTFKHVHHSI